jgi:glycosyltransferase involved in cell wall biosynthesis
MDRKESLRRVAAIVPAHNEATRIGAVLEVLASYKKFDEVIVVNDGSTDETEKVVKKFPVRYILNDSNHGKAHAMQKGVDECTSDIIFFCDADILGLTHKMIDSILDPVLEGKVEMFVGMRKRGWYGAHNVLAFVPILGGERALTKKLWQDLPEYYKDKFKIETGLNFYAKYHGKNYSYKVIAGLSQVIKEKKYGFWEGMYRRFGMYKDVVLAQIRLELVDIPYNVQQGVYSLYGLVLSLFFLALGVQMLLMLKTQPEGFWYKVIQSNFSVPNTHLWNNFLSLIRRHNDYNLGTIAVILIIAGILSALFYLHRVVRFFNKTRQK